MSSRLKRALKPSSGKVPLEKEPNTTVQQQVEKEDNPKEEHIKELPKQVSITIGNIHTLLLLLQSDESSVIAPTVESIAAYVGVSVLNKTEFVRLGGLRALKNIYHRCDYDSKKVIFGILQQLTDTASVRSLLHVELFVTEAIDLLGATQSGVDLLQTAMNYALTMLEEGDSVLKVSSHANLFELLATAANNANEVQLIILLIIEKLCNEFSNKIEFGAKHGGIHMLAGILPTGSTQVQAIVCRVLVSCLGEHFNRVLFRDILPNIFGLLISLLEKEATASEAAAVLDICVRDGLCRKVVLQKELLRNWDDILLRSSNPICRKHILSLMSSLCHETPQTILQVDLQVITKLQDLFIEEVPEVQANLMFITSLLISNSEDRHNFIKNPKAYEWIVSTALQLLSCGNDTIVLAALKNLQLLLPYDAIRNRFTSNGGIQALQKLLSRQLPVNDIVITCLVALELLLHSSAARQQMCLNGTAQALDWNLCNTKDMVVAEHALRVVSAFMSYPEGCNAIRQTTIVQFLAANLLDVRQTPLQVCILALWAVNKFVQQLPNEVVLNYISEAAVQQIKELQYVDGGMLSPVLPIVLNTITTKSATAALWIKDRLEHTDKVTLGFYDFGRSRHFWSLQHLQKQPVDHDLEVLLHDVTELPTALEALRKLDIVLRAKKLAQFVSDQLGGSQDIRNYNPSFYLTDMNNFKHETGSNVIPIFRLRKGAYRHRAFLFKVLSDMLHIPCTLERGIYNGKSHSWNSVYTNGRHYVVDLMHSTGALYDADSAEAGSYTKMTIK